MSELYFLTVFSEVFELTTLENIIDSICLSGAVNIFQEIFT